jgi:predicted MFS family arabinose efflux permease
LLGAFLVIESKVAHPLIPLRVLFERTRGGSLIAVLLLGIGMFAVFLFLTYYLQQNLGFSPIGSGAAFLPMIAGLAVTATLTTSLVLPRVGPRPLIPAGFLVAAAGMFWLAQLGVAASYAGAVLGPIIVVGIGMGLAMAPAMSAGTSGVRASDAGVASALVNTAQQVGGSIGTAVLSTIAASAAADYLTGKIPSAQLAAAAAVDSYTTTFAWVACFFVIGAIAAAALLPSGPLKSDPAAAPAAHM